MSAKLARVDSYEEFEQYLELDESSQSRLIERLLKDGILTNIQLQTIEDETRQTDENLLVAMVKSRIVAKSIVDAYIENTDVDSIDLKSIQIDPETSRKIPKELSVTNYLIAFLEDRRSVHIAFSNPSDIDNIDFLSSFFDGKNIVKYLAKEADILSMIDKVYEYNFTIGDIIDEMEALNGIDLHGSDATYKSPIIRFLDAVLHDGVHKDASDIHIQPDDGFVRIRYRIDGVMQNQFTLNSKFYQSVVVRIKIISGMNIAESIKPQDGSIKTSIMGRAIDFRVSLMPTIFGEGVVIRILDKKDNISSLLKLGIAKDNYDKIIKIISKPEGVLIMTGPTGSGKTTTLYAMMAQIVSPEINMMTLEDPVEYHMPMARQMNVNQSAGITFASGLRSILRQDPDVILVGEMRDEETAITAMRAAMTGHRVFSTLHTNDASSAINRLLDLGISPHIISSSINGIIAQRLVRKLCPNCKIKHEITDEEYAKFKLRKKEGAVFYAYSENAKGCESCNKTGFRGRAAVLEVLYFDKELRGMIEDGVTEHKIAASLLESKKFSPMQTDAIRKVLQGVTSFAEIERVIDMSEY